MIATNQYCIITITITSTDLVTDLVSDLVTDLVTDLVSESANQSYLPCVIPFLELHKNLYTNYNYSELATTQISYCVTLV